MKLSVKLVAILLGAWAFLLSSCDKDNIVEVSKSKITGKWILEKETLDERKDESPSECETKKNYEEFLADGRVLSVDYSNCKSISVNKTVETWSLEGNFVKTRGYYGNNPLTSKYVDIVFSVEKLTNDEMILNMIKVSPNEDGKKHTYRKYYRRLNAIDSYIDKNVSVVESVNMLKGSSITLSELIMLKYGKQGKLDVKSSNERVATVDSEGRIKAVGIGSAKIIYVSESGQKSSISEIYVYGYKAEEKEEVSINKGNIVGKWVPKIVNSEKEKEQCFSRESYIDFRSDGVLAYVTYNSDCSPVVDDEMKWSLVEISSVEIVFLPIKTPESKDVEKHVERFKVTKLTRDTMDLEDSEGGTTTYKRLSE